MSEAISHHIPEAVMASYVAGTLPHAFSLVVASHISLCDECRTRQLAHEAVGGAVLDSVASEPLTGALRDNVFGALDDPIEADPIPAARRGVYPGPVAELLKGKDPKWKALGGGVKQCILHMDGEGSSRLLYIPGGQAVPDHGHNGMEMTLVLQGAFSDETGDFGVGDVEVADSDLDHVPVAKDGEACICLAATDAPLKFNTFLPRLLQPLFGI